MKLSQRLCCVSVKLRLGNAVYLWKIKFAIFDRQEVKYVRAKMFFAGHLLSPGGKAPSTRYLAASLLVREPPKESLLLG